MRPPRLGRGTVVLGGEREEDASGRAPGGADRGLGAAAAAGAAASCCCCLLLLLLRAAVAHERAAQTALRRGGEQRIEGVDSSGEGPLLLLLLLA